MWWRLSQAFAGGEQGNGLERLRQGAEKRLWSADELRWILSDENPVRKWFDPQASLAQAQAAPGIVPQAAADDIAARASVETVDPDAIADDIRTTRHPPSARASLACAAARIRRCRLGGRMEGAARDMHGRRARTPDRRPRAGTPPVFRPARKVRESSDRDTVRGQFRRRLSGTSIPHGQAVSMRPDGTVMAPFLPASGGDQKAIFLPGKSRCGAASKGGSTPSRGWVHLC